MKKTAMLQVKRVLLRCAFGLLALCFSSLAAHAQDVRVNCQQNPTCTLTPAGGIAWGAGNLTYIFRPMAPNVSLYVYLHNNNSTSAHSSQTVKVFQTPYGQDAATSLSLTSSKWIQDTLTQATTVGASCNNVNALVDNSAGASGLGSCYVNTMFAAQIAIQISGATTQAGSPDTYDLLIVQQTGQPGGPNPGGIGGSYSQVDPCGSAAVHKNTVIVNGSSATTFVIHGPANGKTVYPCAYSIVMYSANAGESVTFEYGTQIGTPCDTGTTTLSGAMGLGQAATPLVLSAGFGMTLFDLPVNNTLCMVLAGTAPTAKGFFVYAEQ